MRFVVSHGKECALQHLNEIKHMGLIMASSWPNLEGLSLSATSAASQCK
jgi:hypothetical protein